MKPTVEDKRLGVIAALTIVRVLHQPVTAMDDSDNSTGEEDNKGFTRFG